jgi:hypothetical protein
MGVATTYMTPGLRLMFSRSALAFVVLSVMMTLYGCQSTSTSSDPKTRKSPATQDKPAKAKSKSVRSSATPETEARLDAAELWFEGGDPYLARLSMRDIDISNLTGSARARALLIHVQTDLALGLIDEAAAALADPGFSTGEKARLRADLCQQMNSSALPKPREGPRITIIASGMLSCEPRPEKGTLPGSVQTDHCRGGSIWSTWSGGRHRYKRNGRLFRNGVKGIRTTVQRANFRMPSIICSPTILQHR